MDTATYAPRILSIDQSYWLDDGGQVELPLRSIVVRRQGGTCYAAKPTGALQEAYVNGQPLTTERALQDGDFLHFGVQRFFFQPDPAADWRARPPLTRPLQLNKNLAKHVILNGDTISFDGGQTSAKWGDITALNLEPNNNRWQVYPSLRVKQKADTKLVKIGNGDAALLLRWLQTVTPFALSIRGAANHRQNYPDPYLAVADKVVQRIKSGQVSMPVDVRFIKGGMLRDDLLRQGLLRLGGGIIGVIIGLVISTASYQSVSRSGGTYFIAYGPVIFGGLAALSGLYYLLRAMGAPGSSSG